MSKKFTGSCIALGLLSGACGPSDGAVFFVATRGGATDTVAIDVRNVTGVDFDAFRQDGTPAAEEGDCAVFVGNKFDDIAGLETPGIRADIGLITLEGASGQANLNFIFNVDNEVYESNAENEQLFIPGDNLTIKGEGGADIIGDFDRNLDLLSKNVEFPQDVIIGALPSILPGTDTTITWNEADDGADEVEVIIFATDLFGQDGVSVVCRTNDDGAVDIDGALTSLLPSGGLFNTVQIVRLNGDNIFLDTDQIADDLERGKEFFLTAISFDISIGELEVN